MKKLFEITFLPSNQKVRVEKGTTIKDAAQSACINIQGECGGHGRCGKCQVVVIPPKNSSPQKKPSLLTQLEKEFLPIIKDIDSHTLACQTQINGPLTVFVLSELNENEVIQGKTKIEGLFPIDPLVQRFFINQLSMGSAINDLKKDVISSIQEKIHQIIGQKICFNEPAAIQKLSLPEYHSGNITLVHHEFCGVTAVLFGKKEKSLGLAVDIGTTTIAAYLCDMKNGKVLTAEGMLNPQCRYGEDVISRISMSSQSKDGLPLLQKIVVKAVNQLIRSCLETAKASCEDIDEVTVVGNTTMEQIFAGIHPHSLGISPYLPIIQNIPDHKARNLGLDLSSGTNVYFFPVESGFLGGDILAAILAEGAHHRDETCLIIDIGTNGELALVTSNKILTTSCATGPAFEGGQLSCGMRATQGAVYQVRKESNKKKFFCRILGEEDGVKAAGICGSGVIDTIAVMCKTGLILSNGRLNEKKSEVICDDNGVGRKVIIVPPEKSQTDEGIFITLHDIRQVQLAKAAMAVGIEFLLQKAGVTQVDKTVLTGAFGARFNWQNAIDIGMFPVEFSKSRVVTTQNLAGVGAIMALLDKKKRTEIKHIQGKIHNIELAGQVDFSEKFALATLFPSFKKINN